MNMDKLKANFQLIGYRIVSFSLETETIIVASPDYKIKENDIDYNIKIMQKDELEDEEFWLGILCFELKMSGVSSGFDDDDDNQPCFNIELVLEAGFTGNVEMQENDFESLLSLNGVSILTQIARSYIQSITAQSGFSKMVSFPMINIFELNKLKEECDKED